MVTGPLGAVTGGFLPTLCPPPTAAQAAALANQPGAGAQAAAAKIQADEAGAKARVAAVEYLGTVDCSRWPEASDALVKALLEDHNECVRFAAAKALNSGCCCNKDTIEALRICVSGETKKGNAPETSPRVKAAAFAALQNCLMKVPEDLPPEKPPTPERSQTPGVPPPPRPEGRSSMNAADGTHIATAYTSESSERLRRHRSATTKIVQPDCRRGTPHFVSSLPQSAPAQPSCRPASEACSTCWPRPGRTPRPRPCSTPASRARFRLRPTRSTRASRRPPTALPRRTVQATRSPPTTRNPMAVSAVDVPNQQTGNDPSTIAPNNNARRGLIGMLFQSRDRQADQ